MINAGPAMSLGLQSRRLAAVASTRSSVSLRPFIASNAQRRTFGFGGWNSGGKKTTQQAPVNPLTEEYLTRKPAKNPTLVRGGLASSSVFEDEEITGPKPAELKGQEKGAIYARNPDAMAAKLDPRPKAREKWERKMVIRDISRRGRLSRTQVIKRTERELLSRSHDYKTSVKKLGPLARQIAGKSVDEAILQMRFSKKRVASEVRMHLEHARNEAIVARGMGLGAVEGKKLDKPVLIQTKDGKRIKVDDPTRLYVEQAWVGKGNHTFSPDHRARGRVHKMINPTTHFSVILKEEATRLRQYAEREEKIKNRKVWVQLPNRPITSQRQYYSW